MDPKGTSVHEDLLGRGVLSGAYLLTIYIVISKEGQGQALPQPFCTRCPASLPRAFRAPFTPAPPATDRRRLHRWPSPARRPPAAGTPRSRKAAPTYPHPVPRLRSVRAQSVPPVPPTPVRTPRRSRGRPKGIPPASPHNNLLRACRPFEERQELSAARGVGEPSNTPISRACRSPAGRGAPNLLRSSSCPDRNRSTAQGPPAPHPHLRPGKGGRRVTRVAPPLIVGLANGAPRMDLTVMVALLGRAGRRRQALCNGASSTIPRLRHRLSFGEAGPATVRSPTGWGAPALNNFFWRRFVSGHRLAGVNSEAENVRLCNRAIFVASATDSATTALWHWPVVVPM